LNNGIARILAVQIVTSDHSKHSSNSDGQSNSHISIGYGTVNHPYNSTTSGHKKKLDQDDEIDPLRFAMKNQKLASNPEIPTTPSAFLITLPIRSPK
jgi:hypothetical protein